VVGDISAPWQRNSADDKCRSDAASFEVGMSGEQWRIRSKSIHGTGIAVAAKAYASPGRQV